MSVANLPLSLLYTFCFWSFKASVEGSQRLRAQKSFSHGSLSAIWRTTALSRPSCSALVALVFRGGTAELGAWQARLG